MIPGVMDLSRSDDGSRVALTVKSGEYRVLVLLTPAQAVAVVAELATLTAAIVHELGAGDRELALVALNHARARQGLPALDRLP